MTKQSTNIPSDSLQYLHVRNWDKWQCYRHDRGQPPWIKVHRRLLRNQNWVALSASQKGELVCIWMLAADQNGVIPACPKLIQKLCCLEREPDLTVLINLGFLDAKTTPRRKAGRRQDVLPKAEAEYRVQNTEAKADYIGQPSVDLTDVPQETKKKGTPDGSRGTRLPNGWLPSSEVHLFAVGLLGESGMAEQLDRFRDYWLAKAGASARKTDWDRTFRNWCRTAKERKGNGYGSGRHIQEDARSTVRAADRLIEAASRGEFSFGPRPRLFSEKSEDDIQLLPKR